MHFCPAIATTTTHARSKIRVDDKVMHNCPGTFALEEGRKWPSSQSCVSTHAAPPSRTASRVERNAARSNGQSSFMHAWSTESQTQRRSHLRDCLLSRMKGQGASLLMCDGVKLNHNVAIARPSTCRARWPCRRWGRLGCMRRIMKKAAIF